MNDENILTEHIVDEKKRDQINQMIKNQIWWMNLSREEREKLRLESIERRKLNWPKVND